MGRLSRPAGAHRRLRMRFVTDNGRQDDETFACFRRDRVMCAFRAASVLFLYPAALKIVRFRLIRARPPLGRV